MKKFTSFLLLAVFTLTTEQGRAQPTFIPIDFKSEPSSSAIAMFPQKGQLANADGEVSEEVLFYSFSANPKLYLLKDNSI